MAVLLLGTACTPSDTARVDTTLPSALSTATTINPRPTTTTLSPATTAVEPVAPQLDLDYGRRNGLIRVIGVHWYGLPDEADHVTVVVAGRPDRLVNKPVVEGETSFELGKPSWTKYAMFTAYDAQGIEVASEEVLLDGGSCSAKGWLPPTEDTGLPSAVSDTRIQLAESVIRCRYADLERAGVEGGTYFEQRPVDLAGELKELDRRQGLMIEILNALLAEPRTEMDGDKTVFVFARPGIQIVIDTEGRWIAASA